MKRSVWMLAATSMAVLLLGVACGSEEAEDHGAAEALATATVARQVTLNMLDIKFEPARVSVKAGEVVEIKFKNEGKLLHDFTVKKIDADVLEMKHEGGPSGAMAAHVAEHDASLAMHIALGAGEDGTLRLRVHEAGEYEYYCTVAGHKEAGMVGKLVVTR